MKTEERKPRDLSKHFARQNWRVTTPAGKTFELIVPDLATEAEVQKLYPKCRVEAA